MVRVYRLALVSLGCLDGSAVGVKVGDPVGRLVGSVVGASDGSKLGGVGNKLGWLLALSLGCLLVT